MSHEIITTCPVCEHGLHVTGLHCSRCKTSYQGRFTLDKFSYLTKNEKYFIEIFLKCRGNIKEVEKELGISYPTVRNRLDGIVKSLGYDVDTCAEDSIDRKEILKMVEKGEINIDEAIGRLKGN